MAFGQINNKMDARLKDMIKSNPQTSNFISSQNNAPKLSTYNSRYPGFDEEDYKRLVQIADEQGVTGSKKAQLMDELYQYYYPQVLNSHKLDERQEQINKAVYDNGDALVNGEPQANLNLKLTQLSQKAKEKFGIAYDTPDMDVITAMRDNIPDGERLLEEYVNNGNPELLYQAGIYDRPQIENTSGIQQGGIKSLINPASEGGILPESNWEWLNPIGAVSETVDNAANKFAQKFTVSGEDAANKLADRINNLTPEEIENYKKQYINMINNLEDDEDYTLGEGLSDLLSAAWHGSAGRLFGTEDKAYEAAARLTQSKKKEGGGYVVDRQSRLNDEDFLKWVISQEVSLGESLIGADDILKGETNPNVIRFFSNIPSSAVKTFTATVRGMTNPYDTMKGLYKLAATKEGHQALLQRYGSWDALANAMNTDPVGVADDVLAVAELGTNIAKGGLKATGKITGNQNLANMANNIPTVGSANDALAQKTVGGIYGGLDKLAGMTDNKLVQGANRYVQDVSSMQKLLNEGAEGLKKVEESSFGQSIKNAYDEAVNKIVGIDEEDRKFIRENKELVNNQLSKKQNVETIFDEVKDKVSEKRLENTEMGKEYGNLRKNKSKVVNTEGITSDLKKTLKKQGITIDKNNNLKFSDMSKFNAKQKAALIDAWNELKLVEKKKNINAGNVLDMRQKFDDKLNWDGKAVDLKGDVSAVDKATEGLIKDMRGAIDNRAKVSVDGLKELDAKYSEALAEMQQIKKDWLNADGTFKDNARSKLRNLTKAGNEEKLARLEKVIPGITNDLKALDVALTIEKASKQGVGQYAKGNFLGAAGGGAGLGTLFGNPIVGAGLGTVLWILSSPKNYVKLVEKYPDIAQKLSAGQELLPSDMNKLQSWASRIQDGME